MRVEEKLRQSEVRYRNVMEYFPCFILDKDFRYTQVNTLAAAMVHMREEDLLGKRIVDIFPGFETTDFFRLYRRVRETGKAERFSAGFSLPDGSPGTYEVNVFPCAESIQCLAMDITDRSRMEKSLQENLKYLQKILDTTPDGFWVVDMNGKFKDFNAAYCRMSGYNRDEFLRLHIPDIDADEKPSETADRMGRIKTHGHETFQTRCRSKDGSIFNVEISASYFDHHEGEFVCFCRDISERIKVEESLG